MIGTKIAPIIDLEPIILIFVDFKVIIYRNHDKVVFIMIFNKSINAKGVSLIIQKKIEGVTGLNIIITHII